MWLKQAWCKSVSCVGCYMSGVSHVLDVERVSSRQGVRVRGSNADKLEPLPCKSAEHRLVVAIYLEVADHIICTLQQQIPLLSSVMHGMLIGMICVGSAGCR